MPQADPSLSLARRVDAVCDRFEAEWRAGRRPRIDDFVAAAPESDREALRQALRAVELELRGRGQADTSVTRESVRSDRDVSRTTAAAPPDVPKRIGRFAVTAVLGAGAFGRVYRATDPQLGRDVAIKVPLPAALANDTDRERFLREARAAAGLHHPNICPVHEVGEQDGHPYIVMGFVPGQSLAQVLKARKDPLAPKQAALIARKLALALDAAHKKGVVHRDLKPANVMFDRERRDVVVTDFGLARAPRVNDAQTTRDGVLMGTPAYMSPEQARGDTKAVGPASDQYALGVMLYEMLTGRRPFNGTVTEVLGKILHVEPDSPTALRPDLDPKPAAVCLKAMAKDPSARYASMRQFADALAKFATDAPSSRPAPATASAETAKGTTETQRIAEVFAFTEKAVEKAIRKHKTPTWMKVGLGLLGVLAVVIPSVVFFTRSDKVQVDLTVVLKDVDLSDKSLTFFLDEEPVTADVLAKPVELKPGEHVFTVKRGKDIVKRMLFSVNGGKKPGIEVREITPPPTEPVERKKIVWQPLLRTAADLIPKDTTFRKGAQGEIRFADGVLELKGRTGHMVAYQPKFTGKNYIVRAKIVKFEGFNVMFNVRRRPGFAGYGVWFSEQPTGPYGVCKSKDGRTIDLISVRQPVTRKYPLEYAVAVNRDEISVYVNGQRVLAHLDSESSEGGISFATTFDSHVFLRDLEVCVLDNTDLTPNDVFPQRPAGAKIQAAEPNEVPKANVPEAGFVPLFNGKDLTGWKTHASQPGTWQIKDGILTCGPGLSHLYTARDNYSDFDLRLEARVNGGNSGVTVRAPFGPTLGVKAEWVAGYNAKLHAPRMGGLLVDMNPDLHRVREVALRPDDWIAVEVIARGNRVVVKLDGQTTAEYTDPDGRYTAGHIVLLQHSPGAKVEFRKIEIKESAAAADPDRDAAAWVLGVGGAVTIAPEGREAHEVRRIADLPAGPVRLTGVNLWAPAVVRDDDLARLVGLRSLQNVFLVDAPITDAGLAHLGKIPTLQFLQLDGTRVTDAGLKHLAGLRDLKSLQLHRTAVTGSGLKDMPAVPLELLVVGGGGAPTDDVAEVISQFQTLRDLSLGSAVLTDAGLAHLGRLKKLWSLMVGGSRVTDRGLDALRGLTNLSILSVADTQVTDAGLAKLVDMKLPLTAVFVANTGMTDDGLKHLARLPLLEQLHAEKTKVTDAGLAHLAAAPKLRQLFLQNTGLTDTAVGHLKKLAGLKELHLEGTGVSDAGRAELKNALPSCQITPESK